MHFYTSTALIVMLAPPIGGEQINLALERVAEFLSSFVAGAAAVMFVVAGYEWMTSGEFPAREEWAKRAIGAVAGGTILVLLGRILAMAIKTAFIGQQ
jgi:hypothetical protein